MRPFLLLSALLVLATGAARAQDGPPATSAAALPCAPPVLLPPGHWASGAMRRLAAVGPYETGSTATGTLPLTTAARAFEAAAEGAASALVRQLAALYLARLTLEHPGAAAPPAGLSAACPAVVDARFDGGYTVGRGLHRPGFGYEPDHDWTGAITVDPLSSPALGAVVSAGWGAVGARAELTVHQDGVALVDGHLAADLGDVVLWAGRRAPRYGPAGGGGIVFGGEALVTGVGAVVTDPLRLPWIFGLLGPIGMESFFSRATGGERIVDPWLWGGRLTSSPHPRLRIGASRGTMFGGEGNTPVTLRHSLQMLLGMHSGIAGEFDNHFGSVDVRYRPPRLPVDLYAEWGMHDSAGAWWHMPARLVGVHWPILPFAPALGLGAEFVHFPRSCCGNPIWYRNWAFRMGWTDDGVLLGHPLGGQGSEASLRVDAVMAGGTAVAHGRAFRRYRGHENVYWPQWGGTSLGAEAALQIQPGHGPGAVLRGFIEAGEDWRAGRLFAGLTWSFGG